MPIPVMKAIKTNGYMTSSRAVLSTVQTGVGQAPSFAAQLSGATGFSLTLGPDSGILESLRGVAPGVCVCAGAPH